MKTKQDTNTVFNVTKYVQTNTISQNVTLLLEYPVVALIDDIIRAGWKVETAKLGDGVRTVSSRC